MPSKSSSTKIRILFAKNGSKAVIMREGPAKRTRLLLWDTSNDELITGQWINSHIPNFSINSDASLLLAFIQSYRAKYEYGTWVALSKPPWFSALAIWKINDSWGGACSFITDQKIYISSGMTDIIFEGSLAKNMSWTNEESSIVNTPSEWTVSTEDEIPWRIKTSEISGLEIRLKQEIPDQIMLLSKNSDTWGEAEIFEDIFFADFDRQGRAVFTKRDGKIYRAQLVEDKIEIKEVFALQEMEPKAIEAPSEATHW